MSVVLVVLASLLTVVTVLARYVRSEVLDTDRYVETVSPLAREPSVQDAAADQVTNEIVTRLDVESVAEDARRPPRRAGGAAGDHGAGGAAGRSGRVVRPRPRGAVRAVGRVRHLWDDANRRAHAAVVAVLTGETRGALSVDEGAVTSTSAWSWRGSGTAWSIGALDLASNIPDVSSTFTLVESEQLQKAQRSVRILDRAATLLPFVVVALAAVAILVAPNRRRASWRWRSGWRCRWSCWPRRWR